MSTIAAKEKRGLDRPPILGKHLIETLTMGMYTDPMFVYREYIQNSADSIDEAVRRKLLKRRGDGRIVIKVECESRLIEIQDNGTGIEKRNVGAFLGDVANSPKNPSVHKGFRGIGRLGGLGYCSELIFETSAKGESTKSIIRIDAKRLKKIIGNVSEQADAATVIGLITTIEEENEKAELHYFRVRLVGVLDEERVDKLLNLASVANYLSMVAPVPFDETFTFAARIRAFFEEKGVPMEEYAVFLSLNDDQITKAYRTTIRDKNDVKDIGKVIDVDFFTIENEKEKTISIGWYGLTDLLNKAIPKNNLFGGLRLKKGNITIGGDDTLKEFFEADRFNLHFIGEVHVFGSEFVPNARRDNFNESSTVSHFRASLRKRFKLLVDLSRFSSEVRSRYREIEKYWAERESYAEFASKPPVSEATVKSRQVKLSGLKRKAALAKKKLEQVESKYSTNLNARAVFETIVSDINLKIGDSDVDPELIPQSGGFVLDKELSLLEPKIRETLLTVFQLLDSELWFWETERIERLKLSIVRRVVSDQAK